MTFDSLFKESQPNDIPAPPPDSENEALIDAEKTFKISVISAVLFGLASLLIIMSTRMG